MKFRFEYKRLTSCIILLNNKTNSKKQQFKDFTESQYSGIIAQRKTSNKYLRVTITNTISEGYHTKYLRVKITVTFTNTISDFDLSLK